MGIKGLQGQPSILKVSFSSRRKSEQDQAVWIEVPVGANGMMFRALKELICRRRGQRDVVVGTDYKASEKRNTIGLFKV